MKVSLISSTPNAAELLLFTKSTRLEMSPSLFGEIKNWPESKKSEELEYMANTIESSWEFVDYVFMVEGVSRAYTHQQVRNRAASYAQQTMRVLDMAEFEYIFTKRNLESKIAVEIIDNCLDVIKHSYKALVHIEQAPEDARGILPTNISTNICCKFNLREFSYLAKSRTGGRTQDEYQLVINGMVDEVLTIHPWAEKFLFKHERNYFDDIEAFAKREFHDLKKRGELLKIVDKMRKEA